MSETRGEYHTGGGLLQTQKPDVIMQPQRIELRCACCGRPFAIFENNMLVIESRHGGDVHVNKIPLQMAITLNVSQATSLAVI